MICPGRVTTSGVDAEAARPKPNSRNSFKVACSVRSKSSQSPDGELSMKGVRDFRATLDDVAAYSDGP